MAAVIWTDVIQTSIYVIGTIVGFFTILHLVPGGWSTVSSMAWDAGKFRVFDFSWDFHKTYTFWSGVIGGAFLTTASHGTDQLIVQRLLAAKTMRQSQLALSPAGSQSFSNSVCSSWLEPCYSSFTSSFRAVAFSKTDRIFPTFIVTRMPHGVSGLLVAAILAAADVEPQRSLELPFFHHHHGLLREISAEDARKPFDVSFPAVTIAWGIVLFVLAIVSRSGVR